MPHDATSGAIKKSYLQLAKKFHPDVQPGTESVKQFSEINEAYETLSNQKKRDIYDATGMSSNEQQ